MIELHWPSSPGALLLWAQVMLGWGLANYALTGAETRRSAVILRSVLLGVFAFVLAGVGVVAAFFALFTAAVAAAFPLVRPSFAERRMEAEWEVLGTLIFGLGSAWIVAAGRLEVGYGLFALPLPPGRLAVICLGASLALFVGPGGTHVVRGVLDKVGTLPRKAGAVKGEGELDTAEYNRGRVIGNLERLLLVATVALGSYEAMGLIIAAKGLIRIKEFENRDFAEYFLVGTLTSVTVALVLGWLLRVAAMAWW